MRKKTASLIGIVIGSWIFEYLWIRYGLFFDLRIAGIHFIPLFLIPIASVWLVLPGGANIIAVFGRVGKFRWWVAAAVVPAVAVMCAAGLLIFLGYAHPKSDADAAAAGLTLVVDLPLNFVLWFPALLCTELCWRGICGGGGGYGRNGVKDRLVSSVLWMLSLAGFAFAGIGEKNFSFIQPAVVLCSAFLFGRYQSVIFRGSGSILVACFSLLCSLSMMSIIRDVPVTDITPLIEFDPKMRIVSEGSMLVPVALLWIVGMVVNRTRRQSQFT